MKLVALDELLGMEKFKMTQQNKDGWLSRVREGLPDRGVHGEGRLLAEHRHQDLDGKCFSPAGGRV